MRKKGQPLIHPPSGKVQKAERKCAEIHIGEGDCGHKVEDDKCDHGGTNRVCKQLLKKQKKNDPCVKKERNNDNETTEGSVLSNLATAMIDYQKKSSLPDCNMLIFTGDPLEYHRFKQAFEGRGD